MCWWRDDHEKLSAVTVNSSDDNDKKALLRSKMNVIYFQWAGTLSWNQIKLTKPRLVVVVSAASFTHVFLLTDDCKVRNELLKLVLTFSRAILIMLKDIGFQRIYGCSSNYNALFSLNFYPFYLCNASVTQTTYRVKSLMQPSLALRFNNTLLRKFSSSDFN